jgi:2-C-methyl-D-erythritol 4-phosphate cytidylyltransferase
VPGEPGNLKITDPGDLGGAERLLAAREAQETPEAREA